MSNEVVTKYFCTGKINIKLMIPLGKLTNNKKSPIINIKINKTLNNKFPVIVVLKPVCRIYN